MVAVQQTNAFLPLQAGPKYFAEVFIGN